MRYTRLCLAAAFALLTSAPGEAFERVLPAPRIKDNGDVRLSDDLKIGKFQGNKYIATPDALAIQGAGSTGDVSGMSVTPSGSTSALLQTLLQRAPQAEPSDGYIKFLSGPRFGQVVGSNWISLDNGRYTNRDLDWPNTWLPGFGADPSLVTEWVVSRNGGNTARLTASRVSDNSATSGLQNVISDTCLMVADGTDPNKAGWCRYTQVNIPAGKIPGLVLGHEMSVENLASYSVPINPFSAVGPASNVVSGLRVTSGVGRPANDISAYIELNNNGGAKGLAGIMFSNDALNTSSGYAPAMGMAQNQGLTWYNSDGSAGWRVFKNTGNGTGSIVFGNNAFDLYIGTGGENPISIVPGRVTIKDPLTVAAPIQLQGYTVATLPNCAANNNVGSIAYVTDASAAPVYYAAATGGGTTRAPVFCTGGGWVYH